MKLLAVLLVVISIILLSGVLLVTAALYNKRDNPEDTPIKIYESLLGDQSIASVARSLSRPSVGDIGTFGGYDWPDSKVSGVGGSLHMNNPTSLNTVPSSTYVPQSKEGRPSIIGLT